MLARMRLELGSINHQTEVNFTLSPLSCLVLLIWSLIETEMPVTHRNWTLAAAHGLWSLTETGPRCTSS